MPAIVDDDPPGGGSPVSVFESGAILQYLAEKAGKFLPKDLRGKYEVLQWVNWQMGGLGPMAGQANHFNMYAPQFNPPEALTYGQNRYSNEVNRLFGVLNKRLGDRPFVAGDYSIADMAIWPWANFVEQVGIGIEMADFPSVQQWGARIASRPAIARVFSNPATAVDPSYLQKSRVLTDEQWSNVYGERMLAAPRG
jgi:GST-like protein